MIVWGGLSDPLAYVFVNTGGSIQWKIWCSTRCLAEALDWVNHNLLAWHRIRVYIWGHRGDANHGLRKRY
jgi:hypothetical protein